jgi:hypothetical protein
MSSKAFQFSCYNRLFQQFILKFGYLSAFGANHVMMRFITECTLELGGIPELMLDNQIGIEQKNDGIVKRSPAYTKFSLGLHIIIERLDVEMTLDGINGIKYGITFGSFPMPVCLQILSQLLFYLISYVFFHISLYSASKLNLFIIT